MKRLKLILIALGCLLANRYTAQIYPISNTCYVQAGSSPVVSDLCNSINPKLQLVLQNKDFQRPQIDCRLWIRIEGSNGEILETKENYSSQTPITLFSGQIQTLGGDDIAPYLATQNMNMTGFDVQQFLRDGTLPEGNYTFRIIVYHWNGNQQLSSESTTMGFFNLSDPPLLTTPMDGSAVPSLTPQSVLFSWSPRHSPLPDNSLVEYKFELWEILQNRNPQEVALYQQPIQTLTTYNLNQLYAIEHTNLDTGKTYAWRVRAQTSSGKGYFRNNGYSEVYSFRYLAPNAMPYTNAPENFELLKANLTNAEFKWDTDPRYQSYRLEYRVKNGNRWVPTNSTTGDGIANQLEPDREYQAKVQGYNAAADIYGFYSKTIDFRTPKVPVFKCGETPDKKPLPTRPPLAKARKGDVFKMGGFNLYVTNVTGGGGSYSGEGIVNVPFLIQILAGKAPTANPTEALRTGFAVIYSGIQVDDDYNIVSGKVDVVTKGWKSMMTAVMDNEYKEPMSNKPATSTVPDAKVDFVIGGKEDIKLDKEKGEITIKNPNGSPATIKLDKDKATTVIEDKAGNVYSVDNKTGEVIIVGAKAPADGPNAAPSIADAGTMNPAQASVIWSNPTNAIGGLDTKTTKEIAAAFSSKYEAAKLTTPTGDIYAPFKAVRANGSDIITAQVTITDKTTLTDSVRFISLSGIILKPTNVNGSTYTLALTGKDHAAMEVIVAQAKTKAGKWQVIGKLVQRNYKQDPKNLVLIPLGTGVNISKSPIEESLKKYYGNQGGVWNVTVASPVSLPANWQGKTSIDIDAGALSCYTAEMKEVISAYKSQGTYNEKDYYIFVSSIPSKNTAVQGEMPRGEHFGFVFNSSPSGDLIAHELGHGAYYFEHYWQEVKTVQQGSSGGNLMDYPLGSDLRVFQWDDIHERPADFISPCWKSDEAGQLSEIYDLDPNYNPIYVQSSILYIPQATTTSYGTLPGFWSQKKDGAAIKYYKWLNGQYVDEENNPSNLITKYNKTSFDITKSVMLYLYNNTCKARYIIVPYGEIKGKNSSQIEAYFTANFNKLKANGIGSAGYISCSGGNSQVDKKKPKQDDNSGNEVYTKKINQVNISNYNTSASDKFIDSIAISVADLVGENTPVLVNFYNEKDTKPTANIQNGIVLNVKVTTVWDILEIKPLFYISGKPAFDAKFYECVEKKFIENLKLLKEAETYKKSPKPIQKSRELVVYTWTIALEGIICQIGDEPNPNDSCFANVSKGIVVEVLRMTDIPTMINGLEVMGESLLKKCYSNYSQLISDNIKLLTELPKGTVFNIVPKDNNYKTILKTYLAKQLPLSGCFTEKDLVAAGNILDQLKHHYTGGCYQYGKLAVLIVPMVVTGGEWAITKIQKIQTFTKVNKSLVRYIVTLNEELAAKEVFLELIEGTNNIVIKKADGTIVRTITVAELKLPTTATVEEIEVAMQAEIQKELKKVNGAGSILKKVVLGSEDLSQAAINFRKTLAIPNHKGNVAVFEYLDNSGNLVKKAFTTEVGVASHSEELAIDFFTSQNIPKVNIKRIYSELEPCELAGHTCKAKLTENFPTAQKVFSYDYPGGVDNTIRAASVNQRYIDLEQLLK